MSIVNAYVYKGVLFVAKRTKLYRVLGYGPEEYVVELVTNGLGCEGALAIPVDQDDFVFMSRRGIHSQQATNTFGDTTSAFLSSKIQPTFNRFASNRLKYTQGVYVPELNSIAMSFSSNNSTQNDVWLFNTAIQHQDGSRGAWYRWPDISCQSLSRRLVSNTYKLIFGTNDGRVIQAQESGEYADFGTAGISFKVKTGVLYPNGDAVSHKSFRRISMIYRPKGNFTFEARAYIDNATAQSFAFNQISGLDTLGETFTLAQSLLGASAGFSPYTLSMDGLGRGITLEVSQASPNEQVEIYGFIIEYEAEDIRQETE